MQAMTGTGNGGFKVQSSSVHAFVGFGSAAKTSPAGSVAPAMTSATFSREGASPRSRRVLKQAIRRNGSPALSSRRPAAASSMEK